MVDRVLPRFFYDPYLVSLWAAYESGVIEIANYLKTQQQQALNIQDLRGSFLDRARKYFDHVLKFPLCIDNQVWQKLKVIAELRHTIAHCNGRMAALKSGTRSRIEKWLTEDKGISILEGKLLLSDAFLRDAYEVINESLRDLLDRVRSSS